jgi:Uma2 family endonuclease
MAQPAQFADLTPRNLRILYDDLGTFPIDEETYVRLALDDPHTKWELHDGLLLEKPGMSFVHGGIVLWLRDDLVRQLDRTQYLVYADDGRLRRSARTFLIPDLSVVPAALFHRSRLENPEGLGVNNEPMPLVIEVWSPSTGRYDINTKIPEYKRRGDLEIWRLHPAERTLTVWYRQPDGTYSEVVFRGGTVQPTALPGVTIDLDALFDFR